MPGIHVGDIGPLLKCAFKNPDGTVFDISAATTKQISLEDPAGVSRAHAGSFFTNGTDGILTYALAGGDVATAGYWYLQGHLIFPGGNEFHSDRVRFRVWQNNP
jgi:hypothetical protein